MLPDIPYMYDCYMASQDAPDDLAHYEAFFIQVEKRLKRPLTGEETANLNDLYHAQFPDTRTFTERHNQAIPF